MAKVFISTRYIFIHYISTVYSDILDNKVDLDRCVVAIKENLRAHLYKGAFINYVKWKGWVDVSQMSMPIR